MPAHINTKSRPLPYAARQAGTRSLTAKRRAKIWPTVTDWTRHQSDRASTTFRRLGIAAQIIPGTSLYASQVVTVLGPESFAEFAAVKAPGKVIWCNFDLARQLGFTVPQTNQMTAEFHEQLLAALSFRAVRPAENVEGSETITMHADRYGGDGVRPALGAGRAGFLPYGNLYVKGIGFTPLFKHDDPNDFAHSHGGVHLDDCLSEAVFGEVNENLFTQGSTRILAIIDQGKHVTAPTGRKIPVALVVRTGAQLRPAHLLGSPVRRRGYLLRKFLDMVQATGQLVNCPRGETGALIPDVKATMLKVIDDHARTAAESFRWRMIHGALSASNMELSGAMLDLPTQSTQPRTAPICALDYADSVFGTEHLERAARLMTVYRALSRNTPATDREIFKVELISFAGEMKAAYSRHLQVQLLNAAGLKTEVALRIQQEMAETALRFVDVILQMATLKNPGAICVARSVVEHVSVVDVFHLLKNFPQTYFANPEADHTVTIHKYLKPVMRGSRSIQRARVTELAGDFAGIYAELMNGVAAWASEYYDNLESMQSSIISRATFENEPLDCLYSRRLRKELNSTIAAYRASGDGEIIHAAIDRRVSASVRSVDRLLAQGDSRPMSGGGIELQLRTIDGVNYSVRAWNNASQTRRLHVSVPVTRKGNHYRSSVPYLACLTKREIRSLRYRFSTDAWASSTDARGQLCSDEHGGLVIDFDEFNVIQRVGRLEGLFYLDKGGAGDRSEPAPGLRAYVFAIPDRQELLSSLRVIAEPGLKVSCTRQ